MGLLVVAGFLFSSCSNGDVYANRPLSEKTVNRTTMKVDKLTCGSCLSTISEKLSTLDGVVGMGADLGRGLVAVDHKIDVESRRIEEAITSTGYPAKILSVEEIDSSRAFTTANSGRYSGGCYGSTGPAGSSGQGRYGSCCASSDTWKELVRRYSGKDKRNE